MRPYSFNIFEIRKRYYEIFPEPEFKIINMDSEEGAKIKKVNKISYTVNLLPIIGSYYSLNEDTYSKE